MQKHIQQEFLTTDYQVEKIKGTDGKVGLRTAQWKNQRSCCGLHEPMDTDGQGEVGTALRIRQE